jgi:hypothetical protein
VSQIGVSTIRGPASSSTALLTGRSPRFSTQSSSRSQAAALFLARRSSREAVRRPAVRARPQRSFSRRAAAGSCRARLPTLRFRPRRLRPDTVRRDCRDGRSCRDGLADDTAGCRSHGDHTARALASLAYLCQRGRGSTRAVAWSRDLDQPLRCGPVSGYPRGADLARRDLIACPACHRTSPRSSFLVSGAMSPTGGRSW